jgi:hypothetical protein
MRQKRWLHLLICGALLPLSLLGCLASDDGPDNMKSEVETLAAFACGAFFLLSLISAFVGLRSSDDDTQVRLSIAVGAALVALIILA